MHSDPARLYRILWTALTRTKGMSAWLLLPMSLTVASPLILLAWEFTLPQRPDLQHTAFLLRNGAYSLGVVLMVLAGTVGRAMEEHAAARALHLKRWIASPKAATLRLGSSKAPRGSTEPVEEPAVLRPGVEVIVRPVIAGAGAACLGFAGAMTVVVVFRGGALMPWGPRWEALLWGGFVLTMLAVGLGGISLTTRRLFQWTEAQAAREAAARAESNRAELTALQAQMAPQFLLGTLSTVASLAEADAPRAERIVERLSVVLRHALNGAAQPVVPLDDELAFVREYLAVEQEKLGERLAVTLTLDPRTGGLGVPARCLYPLVENAIRFAVNDRPAGGRIAIATELSGRKLRLSVEDNGPGFASDSKDGSGLGQVRRQLQALYAGAAELDTESAHDRTRVTVTVPVPQV